MLKRIKYKNIFIVFVLLIIMIGILFNPEASMDSAKDGLYIWLNLLLPSLFPFVFISNLLIVFGFVKFLGKFLEPIMKPIFNVSGAGLFPFLISMMSGYPIGAKLSASLRDNNLISKTEGNRLISFSSTSGPLFILGTVMIGMIGINAAPLFIIPHYLGVITVGIFFRFYKKNDTDKFTRVQKEEKQVYKTLGSSMGYAVKDSMNSMLLIGGYVIIFTVIINLVLNSNGFSNILNYTSSIFKINPDIIRGLLAGIIELTNGCHIVSNLDIDIFHKILIINFLISWGGLSINSQAISFISQTDLSTGIYLVSKFFHGIFSAIYTYIIFQLIYKDRIVTVFYELNIPLDKPTIHTWFEMFKSSTSIAVYGIILMILVAIFINEMKKRT